MASIKSINLLPEVFRTDTNKKFLAATVDQLISEPDFKRIDNFVGRTFASTFKYGDSYVEEPSKDRQNYQLEPSFVAQDQNKNITFYSSYIDLIQKIAYYGGLTNDHSRLFENESYNFNGLFDFDKFVNFSQYFWMPDGPPEIAVSANAVNDVLAFDVTRDSTQTAYTFTGYSQDPNPILTLVKGNVYRFNLSQTGRKFWIQTAAGRTGTRSTEAESLIRDVLGVENNGNDSGTLIFNVPPTDAQDPLRFANRVATVNFATSLTYSQVQNHLLTAIKNNGGVDGTFSRSLNGCTIIFLRATEDVADWTDKGTFDFDRFDQDLPNPVSGYEQGDIVPEQKRYDIFRCRVTNVGSTNGLVQLEHVQAVDIGDKVYISGGNANAGVEYIKNAEGYWEKVGNITSPLTELYYQDDSDDRYFGVIKLIEPNQALIDVNKDIIGKKNYTSPNGVRFTNGMKIRFDNTATPTAYADSVYIIEGVGKSIRLVNVGNLAVPEEYALTDQLSTPDYITISRGSKDLNAWSRSNRWFHSELLTLAAEYNRDPSLILTTAFRATRPIIEFESDLYLYNYGQTAKAPVDVLDYSVTDAFKEVEGKESFTITLPNNVSRPLTAGTRVIFAADKNPEVRNRIYRIDFITTAAGTKIHLVSENTEILPTYKVQSATIVEDTNVSFIGGSPDFPAEATLEIDPTTGEIQEINFANLGVNYRDVPEVAFVGGGVGSGAEVEISVINGSINGYEILSRGSGYNVAPVYNFVPTVTFSAPVPSLGAVQAKGTAVMTPTTLANVVVDYRGLNFVADPFVKINTNFTADAQINPVYSPFKYVDHIRITNAGSGVGAVSVATIASPNALEKTTVYANAAVFTSNVVDLSNTTSLAVGQFVYAEGVTGGTTIAGIISGTKILLSSPAAIQNNRKYVFKSAAATAVSLRATYANTTVFSSQLVSFNSVTGLNVNDRVFGEGVPVGTVIDDVFGNLVVKMSNIVQIKNDRNYIFKPPSINTATVTTTTRNSDLVYVDSSSVAGVDMFVTGGAAPVAITNIQIDNPVVITTNDAHNLLDGDNVVIRGVVGTTELNNNTYRVEVIDIFKFRLYADDARQVTLDGRNYTPYVSGGVAAGYTIENNIKVKKLLSENLVQLTAPVSVRLGTVLSFVGRTATATVATDSSEVYAITITDSGSGYTSVPAISLTYGGAVAPTATAVLNDNILEYYKIVSGGSGYEITQNLVTEIITNVEIATLNNTAYGTRVLTFADSDSVKYIKKDWLAFLVIENNAAVSYTDFGLVPYVTNDTTGPDPENYKNYMDVALTQANILKVVGVVETLNAQSEIEYQITLDGDILSVDSDGEQIDLPAGSRIYFTAKNRFFTDGPFANDNPIGDEKSTFEIKQPVNNSFVVSLFDVTGIQKNMQVTDLSNTIGSDVVVETVDVVANRITLSKRINAEAGLTLQFSSAPLATSSLRSTKIKSIRIDDAGAEYTSAPIITIEPAVPAVVKISTSTGTNELLVSDLDGIILGMEVRGEYNVDGNGVTTGASIPKVVNTRIVQTGTATFEYYVVLDQTQPVFEGLLVTFSYATKAIANINSAGETEVFTADVTPDTYEADDTVVISLPTTGQSAIKQRQVGVNTFNQYWYDGTQWLPAQQKTKYNQAPAYDLFDKDGTSISDASVYTGSKFFGSKIFSYKPGTGTRDTQLGFALSYQNFQNVGDIVFENNFDSESFSYIKNKTEIQVPLNQFYLKQKTTQGHAYRNVWTKTTEPSKQYQIITKFFDGNTNYFEIDILPESSETIPYVKVFVDNQLLSESDYTVDKYEQLNVIIINETKLTFDPPSKVDIVIYSKKTSALGFYQVPANIDLNTKNENFSSLTLGQIRQHLVTMCQNNYGLQGNALSTNNLRDLDIKGWFGSILQHASPGMYSALALGDQGFEFVEAIELAQKEYSRFKYKFLDQATKLQIDPDNIPETVDALLDAINVGKNSTMPWYDSDMVPYGKAFTSTIIPILDIRQTRYQIPSLYNDRTPSRRSVLVYLRDDTTGLRQQLVKNKDFTFNQTISAIDLSSNLELAFTQYLELIDRPSTVGSYVPETPTKLGLHPSYVPRVFMDLTYQTPREVIQGHDGSITPTFGDLRDELLLELELRIYNNIKVRYTNTILDIVDSIPGKFRKINYSLTEFNQLLTRNFLRWAGVNLYDYTTNSTFESNNAWTWNYRFLKDKDGESLPGFWRGIYSYYFDTDTPNLTPWEMLGFYEQPSWWEDRYGPAPYTGSNTVLWDDLELGYIAHGDRAGIDARFARPGLKQFIPVDEYGTLKSPEKFAPAAFDPSRLSANWTVGDHGPVETAWRRSSEYAYALQIAIALSRPAFYFGSLMNTNEYKRNSLVDQFLQESTNQRIKANNFAVPDDGVISGNVNLVAGYINWVRDWFKHKAIDGTKKIKNLLETVDVKLSYKMAGYSDPNFLTVVADQSSPVSQASSIIFPPENYKIFVNKSAPVEKIIYSAVIIERTTTGFAVRGYNFDAPYFTIIPSRVNNNNFVITAIEQRAIVYRDFEAVKVNVPYGFEFENRQQVVDFLVGYGRYLIAQGFVFDTYSSELESRQDWILSAREFLTWSQQGWESGNLLVLSPVFNSIKINNTNGVIDHLNNLSSGSRLLDQNFNVIKNSQFSVVRDENAFIVSSVFGHTIGLAVLNLVQYEHVLLLDNQTVFGDTIYQPSLGTRQLRLRLIGNKTNNWTGQFNPAGFIYNSDTVDAWQPNRNYRKGTLINFKDKLYYAIVDVPAAAEFDFTLWSNIEKNKIKTGLLPNFAYNADKFTNIYNLDDATSDSALDALSNGITGFRNRNYFQDFKLDSVSQSKFYQGYIKQKGSINAIDALTTARFENLFSTIDLYEEWAFRVGDYGALGSDQSVEFLLPDQTIKSNPSTLVLQGDQDANVDGFINVRKADIYTTTETSFVKNPIANRNDTKTRPSDAVTAGYPRLDDIDATIFDIRDYGTYADLVNSIGAGYKIWVAKDLNNSWNVYRVTETDVLINQLQIALDNKITVITDRPHDLTVGTLIAIKNFDADFNGFYRVTATPENTVFLVDGYKGLARLKSQQKVEGTGILLSLNSVRFSTINQLVDYVPRHGWRDQDKVWIDNDLGEELWAVYEKNIGWQFDELLPLREGEAQTDQGYGYSIAISNNQKLVIAGAKDYSTGGISALRIENGGFLYESPDATFSAPELPDGLNVTVDLFTESDTLYRARLTNNGSNYSVVPNIVIVDTNTVTTVGNVYTGNTFVLSSLTTSVNKIAQQSTYQSKTITLTNINDIWVGDTVSGNDTTGNVISSAIVGNINYQANTITLTSNVSWAASTLQSLTFTHRLVYLGDIITGIDNTGNVIAEDTVVTVINTLTNSIETGFRTNTFNGAQILTLTRGTGGNVQARLAPTTIASITVLNGGSGFVTPPLVELIGGGGTGAKVSVSLVTTGAGTGSIQSIDILDGGFGYTHAPEINLITTNINSGASFRVNLTPVSVASLLVAAKGSGYKHPRLVLTTPAGGTGSGAAGNVNVTNKTISRTRLREFGSGYTNTPSVIITDEAGDGFGAELSVARSTGAVRAFQLEEGTFTQVQNIAPFGVDSDEFGFAIDIASQLAYVGAPGSFENRGAVLVSQSTGSNWVPQQILYNLESQINDRFGHSVVVSDNQDWLYVGAPGANKVFAYARKSTKNNQQKINVVPREISYLTNFVTLKATNQLKVVGSSGRLYEPNFDYTLLAGVVTFRNFAVIEAEDFLYLSQIYPATLIVPLTIRGVLQRSYAINVTLTDVEQVNVLGADGRLFIYGLDYNLTGITINFLNDEFADQASILVNVLNDYYVLIDTIEPTDQITWESSVQENVVSRETIAGTVNTYAGMVAGAFVTGDIIKVLNLQLSGAYNAYQLYRKTESSFALLGTENLKVTRGVAKFGWSLAIDPEGYQLVVGAPEARAEVDGETLQAVGKSYVFDREYQVFVAAATSSVFYTTLTAIERVTRVTVDGIELEQDVDYVIGAAGQTGVSAIVLLSGGANYTSAPTVIITGGGGTGATATAQINVATGKVENIVLTNAGSGYTTAPSITLTGGGPTVPADVATAFAIIPEQNIINFTSVLRTGAKIKVDINKFNLIQRLENPDPIRDAYYGISSAISQNKKNIFIGAPGYRDVDYYNGKVYRYANEPLNYGQIIGTKGNVQLVQGDYIRVNDIPVVFQSTNKDTTKPVKDINEKNIVGILARTDGVNGIEFFTADAIPLRGTGYYTANVAITLSPPDRIETGIQATVGNITLFANGAINSYVITNRGSGYTFAPAVTITGANTAAAKAYATIDSSQITIVANVNAKSQSVSVLPGFGTALQDLGLEVFNLVQEFQHPDLGAPEKFGKLVRVDNQTGDTLVVSSEGGVTLKNSSFDDLFTVFDKDTTRFVDTLRNSGAVYLYDLLPIPNETVENPSQYLYNQVLSNSLILFGDNFGSGVDIRNNWIVVGANKSDYYTQDGGILHLFVNQQNKKGWNRLRSRDSKVDIDYVNQGFLYNNKTQLIVADLDYYDPAKGKILGIADQDLDYKTIYDPAIYNRGTGVDQTFDSSSAWAQNQVGKTWWNLDLCRFINYEQGELNYRVVHWGEFFPESVIEVCEWVESFALPSEYAALVGDGEAKYSDDSAYVEFAFLDNQSGLIRTKYYYWVKNKTSVNTVATQRTSSVATLANLIESPRTQNIPYFAVVANNTFSLYNINDYLQSDNIVFKLEYATTLSENIAHSEYELIQQDNPLSVIPEKYISKLIDSLSGENSVGEVVPDLRLRENDKLGISVRPRQTMIKNTTKAVQVFVDYVNRFLLKNLVVRYKDISQLKVSEPIPPNAAGFYNLIVDTIEQLDFVQTQDLIDGYKVLVASDADYEGFWTIYRYQADAEPSVWVLDRIQSYDSNRFWHYATWYADGFNDQTQIDFIVQEFKDIVTLDLLPGQVIKVLDDGNGQFELFTLNDQGNLIIIGAENGTIQLSESLYDADQSLVGFDNAPFDNIGFSKTAAVEMRNIVQGLLKGIFTDTDLVQINNTFFVLINYILSEQKTLDWLIKTSLVSVVHKIRKLLQFNSYIRDQQDYFEDYIKEVKPYRTQIRNYLLDYEGQDDVAANTTDFDLPSVYDETIRRYRVLVPGSAIDANIIANSSAVAWSTNYKYKIQAIRVTNGGVGYSSLPTVTITGGGGSTATAVASVDFALGQVIDIDLVSPGENFTSQPTVTIEGGGGFGAKAYAVLTTTGGNVSSQTINKTVRTFKNVLSFDRVTYTTTVVKWKPYQTFHSGDVVVVPDVTFAQFNNYQDQLIPRYNFAYRVIKTVLGSETIDLNLFNDASVVQKLNGQDIDNAIDRLAIYNQPGSPDIAQLYSSPDSQRLDASNLNDAAVSQNNEWNRVVHSTQVPFSHEYQYMAIGNRSLLAISATGETWQYVPINENSVNLRDACLFNGNTWIAVGNQATLIKSDNAQTWTKEEVTEFRFSPDANNPQGTLQLNATQAVDFVGVVSIKTTRSNYVVAIGNGNSVLFNPYATSLDIDRGWYSAKPQPRVFLNTKQLLCVHAISFGDLADNNGTTYTVDLQASGYFTLGTQTKMQQGFVVMGGVNGNMFITSFNRLDDLALGYDKTYNYDAGKLGNENYPWIPMAVPSAVQGLGDGTSGEQINAVAISTTFDRWIVAVGSGGTLIWNKLDSPLQIQNGSADLASDTIGETVVDYGVSVFKNFRNFDADNFAFPLTPAAIEKIDFTDIAWDNEKFVVSGTGSTVIWGYPASQSEAYIELGNINPILAGTSILGASSGTLARWDAVVSGTTVTVTINGSALEGTIYSGMTATSAHLPADCVVTSATYNSNTDEWSVVLTFASTSFSARTGQAISFAYVFTANIPVGTVLTFNGPNGKTKTLLVSRLATQGDNIVYVDDFDMIAANWSISGLGIPAGARIKQIGRFAQFTWQYAQGSGRDVFVDYNSVSVNTTTIQLSAPFSANVPAGSTITFFDSTGTKSQFVTTQRLQKNTKTLAFANTLPIGVGFTLEANSALGILGGTQVVSTKQYTIGGVLNHLSKDIPDLIPGTSYTGVKVQGQPFDQTATDILSLDTTISSEFTDSLLGTRPEDIIINGGKFIDTFSSHAPEELVPGQVIDSLQMNVFTANVVGGNVDYGNVIAYKIFTDYKLPTVYYRLSEANTTVLSANLAYDDTEILVSDVSKLPAPDLIRDEPGSIWIAGERINYFGRDLGRNAITNIRRGASRTSIPLAHAAGSLVVDASAAQEITTDSQLSITGDVSVNNGFAGAANTAIYRSAVTTSVPQGQIWLTIGT